MVEEMLHFFQYLWIWWQFGNLVFFIALCKGFRSTQIVGNLWFRYHFSDYLLSICSTCTVVWCIKYVVLPNEIGVNINTYLNLFVLLFLMPSDPVLVWVCTVCVSLCLNCHVCHYQVMLIWQANITKLGWTSFQHLQVPWKKGNWRHGYLLEMQWQHNTLVGIC